VIVAPLTGLRGVGDDSVGYEATVQATDQRGQPVTAVFELLAVRVGRAFVGFSFANQGGPLSQAASVVRAVIDRVAAT
jgi:hypothetical protein